MLDLAVVTAVVTAEDDMTDLIVETGEEAVAPEEEECTIRIRGASGSSVSTECDEHGVHGVA